MPVANKCAVFFANWSRFDGKQIYNFIFLLRQQFWNFSKNY